VKYWKSYARGFRVFNSVRPLVKLNLLRHLLPVKILFAPFDGVLLDDLRPPIPGALAMVLHVQVAEYLGNALDQDAIEARAGACGELLVQGLFPSTLRGLSGHGLDLGSPTTPHSLSSVIAHLELYLEAVSLAGYIEPNTALWDAVSAELKGQRGLWVERTPHDGPLEAGLKDMQPARLRALACLPQLGGAVFRLATRRGSKKSGLFGSGQPLVDWFLDGLETHGQAFTADVQLSEPEGWGECPWSEELDSLFESAFDLEGHSTCFQRSLTDGPFDLLRHAVEQIVTWINEGIAPQDIAVIHPQPEKIWESMELLLGAEGVPLASAGWLRPLIQSRVWNPIWHFLHGLSHLDPYAVATGLNASKRPEVRAWAEVLSMLDQSGQMPFEASIERLPDYLRPKTKALWQDLLSIRTNELSPSDWSEILVDLITSKLRFPSDADDFYAPMGLLRESWGKGRFFGIKSKKLWDFDHMLRTLRIFLESARSLNKQSTSNGIHIVSPSILLDEWNGAEAALILDLSEGSWPAPPISNPDLDWTRRASINAALMLASEGHIGPFPPALQRFWLPKAEHSSQPPRAFQRDAYAFNKVLAMTKQRLTVLSPAQDESGRNLAQGQFWTAIESAAQWEPVADSCASNLHGAWEGFHRTELADNRSKSAQAIGTDALFVSSAPETDRMPGLRPALQNQTQHMNPTLLESLARCPFRTIAERVWRLDASDADDMTSRVNRTVGTIIHRLLQTIFQPVLEVPDWPEAFIANYKLAGADIGALENMLYKCWLENKDGWLVDDIRLNADLAAQAQHQAELLLPNIAAYLKNDLRETCPTIGELALLFPDKISPTARANSKHCLREGWRRTVVGLEQKLGPMGLQVSPAADEKNVSVAGVVDRIELWENFTEYLSFFRIIDYKTSTSQRLNAYAAGNAPLSSHLQTPLYTWMASETFDCLATSVLIPLREADPKPFTHHLKRLAEINSQGGQWQSTLAQTLVRLDARVEEGDFPPTPGDHCRHCKFDALCARPVDIAAFDDGETND